MGKVLRVAIVGAGPSAVFTAAELGKRREDLAVDILDRLPTPFGLVRYGVAPDHHKIKAVSGSMAKTFADPRIAFFGNITVGTDPSFEELREAYDCVVVATGAQRAHSMGIPGEDLAGNYAAADLVAWYNGHPVTGIPYATTADSVAVIGAGNVSLDIARILLKGGSGLDDTDVPDGVRETLESRPVRDVHIIARRGAADVKFSQAELLEFDKLDGIDPIVAHNDVPEIEDADRAVAHRLEIFRRWSTQPRDPAAKRLRFHFRRSPVQVLGNSEVRGLCLRHNPANPADQSVEPPDVTTTLTVQAVIRSIGYHGEPLAGLPFDTQRGVVPHTAGRVAPGVYVTGWIKRGPSGVIGSNKACAIETATSLLTDLDGVSAPTTSARRDALIDRLLTHPDRRRRAVSWNGWSGIDAAEMALGQAHGRTRTKITDLNRLLDIAADAS